VVNSTRSEAATGSPWAVETRAVTKRFDETLANDAVDLALARGQIHGLVGENGAGKSTLMSIVAGLCKADLGEVVVAGAKLPNGSARAAQAAGVGMVHQHFMLIDDFTVLESIVLGNEKGPVLASDKRQARARLKQIAAAYGLQTDPDARIRDLPVGARQKVEILKSLCRNAKLLILDEPTALLTPPETRQLFAILRKLAEDGTTILVVTHKLQEILDVTDTVSVMRRGRLVATMATRDASIQLLADMMVGRHLDLHIDRETVEPGAARLEVQALSCDGHNGRRVLNGINLVVRSGEIVGVAGVAGNGQTELLLALTGLFPISEGKVRLNGVDVTGVGPKALREAGVAHVPEDRLGLGVVPEMSAAWNFILGYQADARYGSFMLDGERVTSDTQGAMESWDVRPVQPSKVFASFSGGNQQKLVLARELARSPDIIIVGEPTRGVDIGAIESIRQRFMKLRQQGKAILMVSSELEELRAVCDRVIVMFDGRIQGELPAAAQEQLFGTLMAGMHHSVDSGVPA